MRVGVGVTGFGLGWLKLPTPHRAALFCRVSPRRSRGVIAVQSFLVPFNLSGRRTPHHHPGQPCSSIAMNTSFWVGSEQRG